MDLDLGSAVNATPEDSDGRCFTGHPGIGPEAVANRRLLMAALTAVEMINYPSEWWHWSWGDRYWAHAVGARTARYGPAAWPLA